MKMFFYQNQQILQGANYNFQKLLNTEEQND